MDTLSFRPAEPDPEPPDAGQPRSGRTRRIVTVVAASTILLGSGAAIGVALTGGASAASTSPATASATTSATAAATAAGRCARITGMLRYSGHPLAAARLTAFCHRPLLRLALVGGQYGQVTFKGGSDGPRTIAFERGTVESAGSTAITVRAADGTTWTWDLIPGTTVRSRGSQVARSQLTTGDLVLVGGPVVSGSREARLIRIRPAAAAGPAGSAGSGATGS